MYECTKTFEIKPPAYSGCGSMLVHKGTLKDYEAEGLCSGCLFYGAVDVDGRLGCSFHWFDDESEDWNYSKNCDELCGM